MRNPNTEQKLVSINRTSDAKSQVAISPIFLKKIYSIGSLKNVDEGIAFCIKNPMKDAMLTGIFTITVNGIEVPLDGVFIGNNGTRLSAVELNDLNPIPFPMGQDVEIHAKIGALSKNREHEIAFSFVTDPYGVLDLEAKDSVIETRQERQKIPCRKEANYDPEVVRQRQEYVEDFTGAKLHHIKHYSFEPEVTKGNIENFTGVAQIPLGFAGPLKINGEYAKGEFLIPLCTSEGTLVASYNRGMKIINMCGGVTTTVMGDSMQRAPVFVFPSAREARDFALWVDEHMDEIRQQAESSSRVAKLIDVEKYLASKFVYLRFNYHTGDAAGQNMVSMATFVACNWILTQVNTVQHFYMDANVTTDKKTSLINMLHTRGKRVIGEIVIPREVMIQHMRVDPETLDHLCRVGNLGAFMAGASNNGLHAANALAAIFMATGQDVANISESSAGMIYTEITPEGDLYGSFTFPSLIVATHGGGTGLPTQRECLEILGCYGPGNVLKFAEIVTAVAAAGEISLAGALSSLDWVTSHERFGKNR
ncbi:MAG: hydroxymethylglutaryl-CoA reductase [Desulfomonilia bacterium]